MKNRRQKPRARTTLEIRGEQPGRSGPRTLTILLSLVALLALFHFIAVVHSAYPTPAVATCDEVIRNTDYTRYVSLTASQSMSAVQFTDTLTTGQPSAMVQIVDKSTQHLQDLYIYGCSTQHGNPALTLLFKQQGLVQGIATVTQARTLSIGQLDTTLAPNRDSFLLPMQENVYREYAWHDGIFSQISFPGLYPVISRSEAEALQEQANREQDLPWKDPLITTAQMAQDLFKWPEQSFHTTIIETNGSTAHVRLTRLTRPQAHMEVIVSLAKLVQSGTNGLWFVTSAQTAGITYNPAQPYTISTSPLLLTGTTADSKSQIVPTLFDHTMTPIPILNETAIHVQADGSYAGKLSYSNPFPNQPGLILIEALPPSPGPDHKNAKRQKAQYNLKQPVGQLLLTTTLLG
ncbi:MAG: hypothetical protein PVSMB5_11340 [Ktedonobacteraceae bacterium]